MATQILLHLDALHESEPPRGTCGRGGRSETV